MLGNTIGNYKVTARLGEGGMGVVYLAEHPGLGRKAAIKVLHPQMAADPQVVSRFFQEARASNAIRHPNIVQAYDFGTLPDGASYIIMEYLEGENLSERIKKQGRLSVRAALDFTCQAAAALAAAHDKGIVHRDLKPDNVFLTPDPRAPAHEQVKILDFGIAKLQGPIDSMSSHKTRTGTLMGTPLYMSPEQCLGVREVDHRTDIYSLGCILYEMLCGAPPFVSEGFGALINMHINQPPDRASQHNPEVTPAVERVLLRMLAKRPIDRVSTMAEVQDALFPIIATASGRSRTGTTPHPGQPLPKISSLALSATTLSASAASAAGVLTSPAWQRRRRTVGAAVAAGAVAVVAVLFFTARARMSATAPAPAPPAAAVTATPAAPDPAAAPAPAARLTDSAETIDVALESEPDGAMVMANGAAIGTTPMIWETTPGGQPVTLTFVLDGYRREVIQAVPAKGLRLAPTLKKAPSHRPRPVAAGRGPAGAAAPDDIKSER